MDNTVNMTLKVKRFFVHLYCDGKFTKLPKLDFIFARVKTGQTGT